MCHGDTQGLSLRPQTQPGRRWRVRGRACPGQAGAAGRLKKHWQFEGTITPALTVTVTVSPTVTRSPGGLSLRPLAQCLVGRAVTALALQYLLLSTVGIMIMIH